MILGGTRGIGAAIARRLAAPGETIVLVYLQDHASAEGIRAELEARGARVRLMAANVAEPGTHKAIGTLLAEAGGRCDRLVHSVAVTSFKPLAAVRPNQWDLTFAVSARSLLDAVVALSEPLARACGAVVAISSQGSVRHVPAYGALGPAKAALEAVVRELAVALAPRGVRVNGVRAGLIESDAVRRLPPEVGEGVARRTPLGRLGTADEIASVAMFLLGPAAAWLTGQVVEADGGLALV